MVGDFAKKHLSLTLKYTYTHLEIAKNTPTNSQVTQRQFESFFLLFCQTNAVNIEKRINKQDNITPKSRLHTQQNINRPCPYPS